MEMGVYETGCCIVECSFWIAMKSKYYLRVFGMKLQYEFRDRKT